METDHLRRRLDALERSVERLRAQTVDQDSIMTEEDYRALLRYREEKMAGRLVDHATLKRELGL